MTNKKKEILDKDTETIDLKNILSTRQWLYDFLGKSFYMKPKLEDFKNTNKINNFEELKKNEDSEDESGIKILSNFFNKALDLTEEDINRLNKEYSKLFVGPGHLLAAPWESVYRSEEKIIFDEHTLAVRDFYKKWGVNTKRVNKEPDDHIGFELEFMSILSSKSIKALEDNNIELFKETILAQNEFLEDHILLWIEEFTDNLIKNTSEEFFKGIGLFSLEYTKMDKELLNDLISDFNSL